MRVCRSGLNLSWFPMGVLLYFSSSLRCLFLEGRAQSSYSDFDDDMFLQACMLGLLEDEWFRGLDLITVKSIFLRLLQRVLVLGL